MRHQDRHHSTAVLSRGGLRRLVGASCLLATLAGCAATFPPIAAVERGDSGFKARIAERYRPGTPAAPLRAELAAQGFRLFEDPMRGRASALFRADNLPCYSQVRIDWTEDRRGRITEIQAQRHDCT